MKHYALSLLLTLLWAVQVEAQWKPPVGVPTPPVGITEVAPAPTLYVDWARGNDANPGTQVSPKKTFPGSLTCGHVRLVGSYPVDYSAPRTIVARGSAACPVWLTGEQNAALTASVELSGTYFFIEKVKFSGFCVWRATPDGQDTHDVFMRDVEITTSGCGVQASFSQAGNVYNAVFLRLNCHDIGDMNTTTDADALCLGIYRDRNHHIWLLD